MDQIYGADCYIDEESRIYYKAESHNQRWNIWERHCIYQNEKGLRFSAIGKLLLNLWWIWYLGLKFSKFTAECIIAYYNSF
jgi:hypothetical protein